MMDWLNNTWGYLVANNLAPMWLTEWGGSRGKFGNATAYWNTLATYMLGTANYTSPNGQKSPTKRTHSSIWDFAKITADDTGIIADNGMVFPNMVLATDAGSAGWLNALITAA